MRLVKLIKVSSGNCLDRLQPIKNRVHCVYFSGLYYINLFAGHKTPRHTSFLMTKMPQRHTIRLRGPWWGVASCGGDADAAATDGGNKSQFKTTIPFGWPDQISSDFAGTVRLTRKFNCSAGMSDADEVWLTISSLAVPAEIRLNGSLVGSTIGAANLQADIEFAISTLLTPFNELVILLEVHGRLPDELLGDVAIEI